MTTINCRVKFQPGEVCIHDSLQLYYIADFQRKNVKVIRKLKSGRTIVLFDEPVWYLEREHSLSYGITPDNKVVNVRINKGTNKYGKFPFPL